MSSGNVFGLPGNCMGGNFHVHKNGGISEALIRFESLKIISHDWFLVFP